MPVAEVLDRVPVEELLDWEEFDAQEHSQEEIRFASLMTKLDHAHWRPKQPRPSLKRHLRPIKRARRSGAAEIAKAWDSMLGIAPAQPPAPLALPATGKA